MKTEKEIKNRIIELKNLIYEDEKRIEEYCEFFIENPEDESDERNNKQVRLNIRIFENRIKKNWERLNTLEWILG